MHPLPAEQNGQQPTMFTQYLIAMAAHEEAVNTEILSAHISSAFVASGVTPAFGMTYVSRYSINPIAAGLRDAWKALSAEQQNELRTNFPDLTFAIELMGVNNADDKKD